MNDVVSEQIDRMAILDVIARERAARDDGDWDKLASTYTQDALIDLSWFKGSGEGFAKASADMASKMFSFHEVGASVIDVRGDRALGDTSCTIHLEGKIYGIETQVLGYIRSRARIQKQDGLWRMAGLRAIYIRDLIVPLNPTRPPPVTDDDLGRYRSSYPGLCVMLVAEGLPAHDDMPGVDKPETVAKLNKAFADALATPKVKQLFASQGLEPAADVSPQQLGRFIASETAKWKDVVKKSGAQLD